MRLNADLGEHFGDWQSGQDDKIMPYIDLANIACGYHAGDAIVMQQTLSLAKQHKVLIGAHISYPDLQGFGRRSMRIPSVQLSAMIQAQIAVLEGLAKCQHLVINHVKPHGALYNDMMANINLFEDVLRSLAEYHTVYPLMILAVADNKTHYDLAKKYNVSLIAEAFADRAYTNSGALVSRGKPNAVLSETKALEQVKHLLNDNKVESESGTFIPIKAETICVHSDTPDAIELCKKIRTLIDDKIV